MKIIKPLYHMFKSQSFEKMSDAPYATHLPILMGVSHFFKISNILEFGSGINSTITFMNRDYFPNVSNITSYENYREWYEKISTETKHDSRVNLKYCEGDMSKFADLENVNDYDLIFIDDSLTLEKRAATIRSVVSRKPKLVVIHDFENFGYRRAAGLKGNRFRFKGFLPNTGLYSNKLDADIIQKIDAVIKKNKNVIKPYDLNGWYRAFSHE